VLRDSQRIRLNYEAETVDEVYIMCLVDSLDMVKKDEKEKKGKGKGNLNNWQTPYAICDKSVCRSVFLSAAFLEFISSNFLLNESRLWFLLLRYSSNIFISKNMLRLA